MISPSWKISVARGIDPGDMPPTSEWWARLATKKAEPAADEDGGDAGDVGQVGAAVIRIVEDDQVAVFESHGGQGGLDREGHGPEVDGDVRALGQGLAVRVEEGAGVSPCAP